MFWFRIELDAKGAVVKSEQVAAAGARDGKPSVFYVTAATLEGAEALAFNEYHRSRLAARREVYRKLGRCKCGRDRSRETQAESAFHPCPKCRLLEREHHARSQRKAKGLPVPPVDKSARFTDRRNEEKLAALEEVREQFNRNTMRNFGLWLNAEIAKLQPKEAPKLRAV